MVNPNTSSVNNISNNTSSIEDNNVQQHQPVDSERLTETSIPQCMQEIPISYSLIDEQTNNQQQEAEENVRSAIETLQYNHEVQPSTQPLPFLQEEHQEVVDERLQLTAIQQSMHETQTPQPSPTPPPPPSYLQVQRLPFCKTPFHAQLVNKKYLRYRLYCILMATAVSVVTLGVLLGIYTEEYFIITVTIPIGLIIFLTDVFCFYGYECYLETNNSDNSRHRHNQTRGTTYCGLFCSNSSLNINQDRTMMNYIESRHNLQRPQQRQQQRNIESSIPGQGCCCRLWRNMKNEQSISTIDTTPYSTNVRGDQPPRYEDIMMNRRFERGRLLIKLCM